MGNFFAKFSKVLHAVGAISAAVGGLAATGVIALPAGVVAAAGGVAYVAGALGKSLFEQPAAK
jgi:hypothetical protein